MVGFAPFSARSCLRCVMARSLTRPLMQVTAAVDRFARGEPMQVPLDAGGEAGVSPGRSRAWQPT